MFSIDYNDQQVQLAVDWLLTASNVPSAFEFSRVCVPAIGATRPTATVKQQVVGKYFLSGPIKIQGDRVDFKI